MEIKFIGKNSGKNIEVCATSGMLSRSKGSVYDVWDKVESMDPIKVENFVNRVIAMGHTSIIDNDYYVFAIKDVSPIVEQTLIESRFSAFTVKSRREVDFGEVGRYTPVFKTKDLTVLDNQKELVNIYTKNQDLLFDSYQCLVDMGIKKEDARYVLPYSFHSQMVMGMSATELERTINMLVNGEKSNIDELREFGELLYEAAIIKGPYLKTLREKRGEQKKSPVAEAFVDIFNKTMDTPFSDTIDEVKLVSCSNDIDDTIFINSLMRIYQVPYEEAISYYNNNIKNNHEYKVNLIKAINKDLCKEDLKSVYFSFQAPISLANLTHLTRHRTIDLSIPSFTTVKKDVITLPPSIEENSSAKNLVINVNGINEIVYNKFQGYGVREEDLVYFNLSGHRVNAGFGLDGATLKHVSALRECNKAQWEVRGIVSEMDRLVTMKSDYYSKIIGPNCAVNGFCPEGAESCGKRFAKKI